VNPNIILTYNSEQSVTLSELGVSLADVAAFMQEIELGQGLTTKRRDQRGIERLRSVALKMRDLSQVSVVFIFVFVRKFHGPLQANNERKG